MLVVHVSGHPKILRYGEGWEQRCAKCYELLKVSGCPFKPFSYIYIGEEREYSEIPGNTPMCVTELKRVELHHIASSYPEITLVPR